MFGTYTKLRQHCFVSGNKDERKFFLIPLALLQYIVLLIGNKVIDRNIFGLCQCYFIVVLLLANKSTRRKKKNLDSISIVSIYYFFNS